MNNNLGGTHFFIAGTTGGIAGGTRNRALIRFDLSSIPENSKIKSVSLKLEVARAPANAAVSSFALHRFLRSWGEGNKNSTDEPSSPGLGYEATINEATWLSPFALTTNSWSSPGAGSDFSPLVSSRTDVYVVGDFPLFNTTTEMIADAQHWIANPGANFGWLLKTETEETFSTARGFGSREFAGIDTNSPPFVSIEFVPPPVISETQVQDGQFQFSFFAEAEQDYKVEWRSAFSSTNLWQTLTNVSGPTSSTNITISDPLSTNAKFYRVVVP